MFRNPRSLCLAGLLLGMLVAPLSGQQSNRPNASLAINGFDTGVGALRTTLTPCSGLALEISSGSNPNQPLLIAIGSLRPRFSNQGSIGLIDLDLSAPRFLVLADGVTGTLGLSPAFNAAARTDASARFLLTASISDGASPPPAYAWQALVADPTAPAGGLMTAAVEVEQRSGTTTTAISVGLNGATGYLLPTGFVFPFYGIAHTRVFIAENGLLGFDRGNGQGLSELAAMTSPFGAFAEPATVASTVLGTAGVIAPPTIGFFEDLDLQSSGTITVHANAETCTFVWCGVQVSGSAAQSDIAITLHSATSSFPGRIELHVAKGALTTASNGRVLGISPGGNGVTSRSPTSGLVDFSSEARQFIAPINNRGRPNGSALSALIESFDFLWALDPLNPVLDLIGETILFDPDPSTPTIYRCRLKNEVRLAVTSVVPSGGPLAGGQTITIKGQGFRDDGSINVMLGNRMVTNLTFIDGETMTGTVPAGLGLGTVGLTMTLGSRGSSATLPGAWTWTNGILVTPLSLSDEGFTRYDFDPSLFRNISLFGTSWTHAFVAANGLLVFSNTPPTPSLFISDPATWDQLPGVVVAPLWNDLCADQVSCGLLTQGQIEVSESATRLLIRWTNWAQWPNVNPGISFSVAFERRPVAGGSAAQITYDYSLSQTPNPMFSQINRMSGIIVGLRGPNAAPTTNAVDLVALAGPTLGAYGAPIFPPTADNLMHWMPSPAYTGGVTPSQNPNTWPFGSLASTGVLGNRALRLRALDPQGTVWEITSL